MIKLNLSILHFSLLILIGCIGASNEEDTSAGFTSAEVKDHRTKLVYKEEVVVFKKPTLELIYPILNKSSIRDIELLFTSLTPGNHIYIYGDQTCYREFITGFSATSSVAYLPQDFTDNSQNLHLSKNMKYNFYLLLRDDDGNFSECYNMNLSYTLDTTAPSLPDIKLVSPDSANDNQNNLRFSATGLEVGGEFEVFFDPLCEEKVFGKKGISATEEFNIALGEDKLYKFYFILTDVLGNRSNCLDSQIKYLLDSTPPDHSEVVFLSPDSLISSNSSVQFLFENLEEKSNLKIYLDESCNNLISSNDLGPLMSFEFNYEIISGDGNYHLSYILTDHIGNSTDCVNTEFIYKFDTTPPGVPNYGERQPVKPEDGPGDIIVKFSNIEETDELYLFSDISCSVEFTNFEIVESINNYQIANLKIEQLGRNEFYGKLRDAAGNIGACSPLIYEYEVTMGLFGKITYDFVPHNKFPLGNTGYKLDFENTEVRPVRNIYLEFIDMDPSSTNYNQVVGSTTTDDYGNYFFPVNSPVTLSARVFAKMQIPHTEVIDNSNYLYPIYSGFSSPKQIVGFQSINFHASSGWNFDNNNYTGERSAAPFAILDSIYTAYKKITDVRENLTFPKLEIYWHVNNEDGAYYMPWANAMNLNGKYGASTDEYDRHVIIHEWGHYFEHNFSRSDSMGGSHRTSEIKDMSLAFGEGFATALSAIVFEPDSTMIDTITPTYGWGMDVEADRFEYNSSPGWFSELSVQQILYDIADSETTLDKNGDVIVESHDQIELGISAIIDVMLDFQKNIESKTSIFSFIAGVKELFPDYTDEFDILTKERKIPESIYDIWGTGTEAYQTLTIGGGKMHLILNGNKSFNDLVANKNIRFKATSTKTRILMTTDGGEHFAYNIRDKGNVISQNGIGFWASPALCGTQGAPYNYAPYLKPPYDFTIDTEVGKTYVLNLFVDKACTTKSSFNVHIEGFSL